MDKFKSIRDQSIEELVSHIIKFGEKSMIKMEYEILQEVLIANRKFGDLVKSRHLTSHRQREIFQMAIKRLIKTINDIHSKLNLFENLEHDFVERQKSDLVETQKKVKALEEKVNVLEAGISNKNVPQEIKDVLVLSIDETNLSARVKTSCSQANIRKVEDLAAYTRTEFLKLRNCGKLSADEVGVFLKSKGLSWGMQF